MSSKSHWTLILGPPGTGKTTALLNTMGRELDVVEPEQIAYMTFMRSARMDAKGRAMDKLGIREDRLPWFRTIHSTAFRLLRLTRTDMMLPTHWREFCARYGYQFSAQSFREDEDVDVTLASDDDALLAVHFWGRSRMVPPERACNRSPFDVDRRSFLRFVDRYTEFRRSIGKYDFYDLLERSQGMTVPVSIAFIDEAQDLSPLQVSLVERWFEHCDRVYVGGDDDQAIMEFVGGDPDWLLRLSRECGKVTILDQSYRVPFTVHSIAQQIINKNKHRVPKTYAAKDDAGEVRVVSNVAGAIKLIDPDKETFVLARNWKYLKEAATTLTEAGIPFAVDKHPSWSVVTRKGAVIAFTAARRLLDGESISPIAWRKLMEQIPARKFDLPVGIKKMTRDNASPVSLGTMGRFGNMSAFIAQLRAGGPAGILVKLDRHTRKGLDSMMRRYGKIPKPMVRLTSMHASKGQQAHTVIVMPQISRSSARAFEKGGHEAEVERRIAYVAVTRAMHRLIIINDSGSRNFPFSTYARRAARELPREPGIDPESWYAGSVTPPLDFQE